MAGRGQRFRDAGYDVPKFEIEVHGRSAVPLVDGEPAVVERARRAVRLPGARRGRRRALHRRASAPPRASPRTTVVALDGTTDGQATTALLARAAVRDVAAPFARLQHRHATSAPHAMRAAARARRRLDPLLPRRRATRWSFARAGDDGRVTEVREKQRISPHATVGLYWFASFAGYADLYERHFARGARRSGRALHRADVQHADRGRRGGVHRVAGARRRRAARDAGRGAALRRRAHARRVARPSAARRGRRSRRLAAISRAASRRARRGSPCSRRRGRRWPLEPDLEAHVAVGEQEPELEVDRPGRRRRRRRSPAAPTRAGPSRCFVVGAAGSPRRCRARAAGRPCRPASA